MLSHTPIQPKKLDALPWARLVRRKRALEALARALTIKLQTMGREDLEALARHIAAYNRTKSRLATVQHYINHAMVKKS